MKVCATITLPASLSFEQECLIVGTVDAATGSYVDYGREIRFRKIVVCPSRPLKKVLGFHPAMNLRICWDSSIGRDEAKATFRQYLLDRAVPIDLARRCEMLFDNAEAVDEEGTLIS